MATFNKLKTKNRKYNSITAAILDNKKFHKKEKLLQVASLLISL